MPEDLETLWERILAQLRREISDVAFHLWLEPLELVARDGALLFVRAPVDIQGSVDQRLGPAMTRAASEVVGSGASVEVVGGDFALPGPEETVEEREHPLNPKYTFGQFVIGSGNRLAHAAALTVAEMPSQAYNPLFLHGSPGLGKTHLLQAIGNYIHGHGMGLSVRYATVEAFTGAFTWAVRNRDTRAFKDSFRGADVLLIDDVQYLAGKEKTEEEFFHTFNSLYESGRQLVISSDRSPADMSEFENRLQERFGCGLVAEIEPPDEDMRLTILRKRASLDPIGAVDDATLREIASRLAVSVRALEGALIRVVAYASLRGEPATPELARAVIGRLYSESAAHTPTVEEVLGAVAGAYGVDVRDLLAHGRTPRTSWARQVAMHLCRELTGESLPEIGRRVGGRNHTTVLHAHRKVAADLTAGNERADAVAAVRRSLKGPPS